MGEKEVVEEEEEVVKVEREVDVEKSNIRAMNVVCSLCMKMSTQKDIHQKAFTWALSQERCQ